MQPTLEPYVANVLFPKSEGNKSRWRKSFDSVGVAALDLIFPPHCITCSEPLDTQTNTALCRKCAGRVRWIGSDRCRRCGDGVGQGSGAVDQCPSCRNHPPAFVKQSCSVAHYAEGPLRDVVLALKFSGKLHLALPAARLIARRIQDTELIPSGTLVVPVPVTTATLRERSFNQSEEIAALIARELKLPLETKLLRKIRSTQPQAVLSHEKRRINLKDAFACDSKRAAKLKGSPVLLIDDVITTCATISECARTLHSAGFTTIFAASLARG